jgi:hypothetical protein
MEAKNMIAVGIIGLLAFSLLFVVMTQPTAHEIASELKIPTADEIAAKVVIPEMEIPTASTIVLNDSALDRLNSIESKIDSLDELTNKVEDKAKNDTAKQLVLEELSTKDNKISIMNLLNENDLENQSVENYKDIKEIYMTEIKSVILAEDSAEVVIEFRVKFLNDGDEDDEGKAKISITCVVEDLVYGDKFEDASVEDCELTLIKFY